MTNQMIRETKTYKAILWKAYFDKGFGLTNQFKYLIVLFGWATADVGMTLLIGILWFIACLIIGRLWFKFKLIDAEHEVQNVVNPFVNEMRSKFGVANIKRLK